MAVVLTACSSSSSTSPATLDGLGSIQYTLDPTRQDVQTYDVNSTNYTVLSVEDANGYRWMLSIPAGALLATQKLTMTAFSTIDRSQSQSGITSGVKLEPDGLFSINAARLMVTPPHGIKRKVGLMFNLSQNQNDQNRMDVALAPTENTDTMAYSDLWHFSGEGYGDNYSDDALATLLNMAKEDYQNAVAAAKLFITNPAPAPPAPPAISMFCRFTEVNPENGEAYEFTKEFISPYEDILNVLASTIKTFQLLGANDQDVNEGYTLLLQVAQKAEKSIMDPGGTYTSETPPDHLYAIIQTALHIAKRVALLGGDTSASLTTITAWEEYIRNYYLDQLKNTHDYRAFPIIITLEKWVELLGGENRLADIMSAMTFEVVVDTSFNATWTDSQGKAQATGSVTQNADVKELTDELRSPDFLWGSPTGGNMVLTSTGGSFTDSGGTVQLAGQKDTSSLWLLNWDACVTKSFDVRLTLVASENNESNTITVAASNAALKDYYWEGAAAFMFTVPMTNKDPNLGHQKRFSGSSSVENIFTGNGWVDISIVHTPK